jgi:nitroreductase
LLATLKKYVRRILEILDRLALPIASVARGVASAYYLLLNPRLGREHRAVLAGRHEYLRSLKAARSSSPMLRRNIHRLEKALVMRPRNPVFAEDYIGETVEAFRRADGHGVLDPAELKWARDVLDAYFAAVGDSAIVARARELHGADDAGEGESSDPAAPSAERERRWQPRPRAAGARGRVEYEDFLQLCRQRRSVRWFEQRAVPRELVERAVTAAAQAPSACNRQPFLFRYFDAPGDAARIAGLAMGTTGYSENLPALIVVLGDLSAFAEERDRHLIYIDGALAAMQLMLALETLGLASCPINWPDIESLERRMARELALPRHVRPVMLIAIGYADPEGGVPFSAKKPVGALLRVSDDYTT